MLFVAGLDSCCNAFEQEIQANASLFHTQPVLGAGEHTKEKKWRELQLPYQLILELFRFGFQLLSCVGMITWNFVVKQGDVIGQVLTFSILSTSLYSAFVWTGMQHVQQEAVHFN